MRLFDRLMGRSADAVTAADAGADVAAADAVSTASLDAVRKTLSDSYLEQSSCL